MTKELPTCFYICWRWQLGDKFNFCFVNLEISSIFALSTSIPLLEIMCPSRIPLLTIKWYFSQLSTRFFSMHLYMMASRLVRHSSKSPPYIVISCMYTSIMRSTISLNMLSIHLWKVVGALQRPKGILLYA